jgi:hypothetical protein
MTQAQLDRTVARRTGESLRTIRHRGFHVQAGPPGDLEPEDLQLCVTCPFCGRSNPLPPGPGGLPALAECEGCDVDFDYRPAEVYAVGPTTPARTTRPRHGIPT